ncbi:MAG: methylmalonyl Co-A mutase-associated GTPase MeaB [Bryobacteraceae bacterium]
MLSIESIRTNPRALARAASTLENGNPELLRELAPHAGHALTIGITGPPGAGKSTLCDQLIRVLRAEGKKVAMIAVDPSSPFTGGALLGDRIRMQRHHADPGVFIRSMAARGWTGGLARATKDLVTLFDAAGYDAVIIETVGVGQSEVEIARLAQVTVVVLTPGAGDDVQSIKAGIMEIAQVFAINKADLPGADMLAKNLHSESPETEVIQVVASEGKGIEDLLAAIRRVHNL